MPADPPPAPSTASGAGLSEAITPEAARAELFRRHGERGDDPNGWPEPPMQHAQDWWLALRALSASTTDAAAGWLNGAWLWEQLFDIFKAPELERFGGGVPIGMGEAFVLRSLAARILTRRLPPHATQASISDPPDAHVEVSGQTTGAAGGRLWWLLHVMERAGGVVDATDNPHSLLNAFCDDAEPTDTFNLAIKRKLIRVTHDSDMDTDTAYLNDTGHAYLAARTQVAPALAGGGVCQTCMGSKTVEHGYTCDDCGGSGDERFGRAQAAPAPAGGGETARSFKAFDAGLLNDYGGGDVAWWWDYIRALLADAHDHYVEHLSDLADEAAVAPTPDAPAKPVRIDESEAERLAEEGLTRPTSITVRRFKPEPGQGGEGGLREAALTTRALVSEFACSGFIDPDVATRLFQNQARLSAALAAPPADAALRSALEAFLKVMPPLALTKDFTDTATASGGQYAVPVGLLRALYALTSSVPRPPADGAPEDAS